MAYLRCPECLTTNTLKKSEAPVAICTACEFAVGNYYFDGRSGDELEAFIKDENFRLKKIREKDVRERRKHQQGASNHIRSDASQPDSDFSYEYRWANVWNHTSNVFFFSALTLLVLLPLKHNFDSFSGVIDTFAVFIDRIFYAPALGGLFELILDSDPGYFHDLRIFLLNTSQGRLVLIATLAYIVVFLLNALAHLLAGYFASGEKGTPFLIVVSIFWGLVLLVQPVWDPSALGATSLYAIYILLHLFYRLIDKVI